jgi:trans-2,3-dihydro-3-hydroxyanthranilate isomerase
VSQGGAASRNPGTLGGMRHVDVVRVFTDGDRGGNHLGIVTDLEGLHDATMQAIAAELGYSETIFVDRSTDPAPVRIFTPTTELPFAGHPLVGAAWSLGAEGAMACGIGVVAFRADPRGASVDIAMTRDVSGTDADGIAAAARFPSPVRAWWAHMPIPYLVVEVTDPQLVIGADPDIAALSQTEAGEATLLFARSGDAIRARFFAPGLGVDEDPATGSAACALAAVLAHEGEGRGTATISQGTEIGHPSEIYISWSEGLIVLAGSVAAEAPRRVDK